MLIKLFIIYLLQLGSIEKVQSPTSDVDTREMLIKLFIIYLLQLGSLEKVQSPTSDVDTREMLIKLFIIYLLQLGSIEKVQSPTSDIDTREMLIKNHFSTRINELTLQLQTSDSKTVSFHAEVVDFIFAPALSQILSCQQRVTVMSCLFTKFLGT